MKKLLKKVTMILCTMAVTIGFVGGSVEEASAASYMSRKKVDVYAHLENLAIPLNAGYVSVTTSNGTSKEVYKSGNGKTSKMTVYVSAATKNSDVKFTVRYKVAGKVSTKSISIKASEVYSLLGGKNVHLRVIGKKNDLSGKIYSVVKK